MLISGNKVNTFLFQTKFHNALETSQRVVKETAETDTANINKLMKSADDIDNSLNMTTTVAEFITQICDHYKLVDVVNTDIIKKDVDYIKTSGQARFEAANEGHFWVPSWIGDIATRNAERMLKIEGNDEREIFFGGSDSSEEEEEEDNSDHNDPIILMYFKACSESNSTIVTIGHFENQMTSTESPLQTSSFSTDQTSASTSGVTITSSPQNGTNVTEMASTQTTTQNQAFVPPTMKPIEDHLPRESINCLTIFDETEEYRSFYEDWAFEYVGKFETMKSEYLETLEPVFVNATKSMYSHPKVIRCLDSLDKLKNISGILKDMFGIMKEMEETRNIQEALPKLQKLYDYYLAWKNVENNFTKYGRDAESEESCEWLRHAVHEGDGDKFEEIGRNVDAAMDHENLAKNSLKDIETAYSKLANVFTEKIYPTLQVAQQYLDRQATKAELVFQFDKPVFIKAIEDMAEYAAEMITYRKDFQNSWNTLSHKLSSNFKEMTKLDLPILNEETVHLLSFVDKAKQVNNTAFNDVIESFDTDVGKGIEQLIQSNYDDISQKAFTAVKDLSGEIDHLIEDISILRVDLKDYQELSRMNVDFYM